MPHPFSDSGDFKDLTDYKAVMFQTKSDIYIKVLKLEKLTRTKSIILLKNGIRYLIATL